ncbi:hypothetical protein P7K49_024646 [Saguinus oedipus]|uniref:Uncharacterized protein n=1 Tax=Saguinus oedipus TaxID=9490 RepID=A0ABQ9UR06_SAGOE|nr:hypothetical protein P7K49_024646 [Saguinus oedipus]
MHVPWNSKATSLPPPYLFWGPLDVSNQQPDSGKVLIGFSSHAVCNTNVETIRKAIANVQAGVKYDGGTHLLPFTALLGTFTSHFGSFCKPPQCFPRNSVLRETSKHSLKLLLLLTPQIVPQFSLETDDKRNLLWRNLTCCLHAMSFTTINYRRQNSLLKLRREDPQETKPEPRLLSSPSSPCWPNVLQLLFGFVETQHSFDHISCAEKWNRIKSPSIVHMRNKEPKYL